MKTLARAALLTAFLSTAAVGAYAQPPAPATPADTMFRATTLNLSAFGEVRTAPDMANITVGVTTEAQTAAEAMRANAQRMSQVVAQLRQQGIAERDIQTSNLSLNPQYRYVENRAPELIGYQATNNVTTRVLDLSRLGGALDAAVSVGANQIHGISFGLLDPKRAEDEARRKAVQALAAKAELYAGATNHRIGRLVNLTEGGGYSPPPPMPMMAMARMESRDSSTPVSAGEVVVRIDVSALYELTR